MRPLPQLRKISDLNDMFANEMIDVLGVVDTAQDSAIIQTKDGRDVSLQLSLTGLYLQFQHVSGCMTALLRRHDTRMLSAAVTALLQWSLSTSLQSKLPRKELQNLLLLLNRSCC